MILFSEYFLLVWVNDAIYFCKDYNANKQNF